MGKHGLPMFHFGSTKLGGSCNRREVEIGFCFVTLRSGESRIESLRQSCRQSFELVPIDSSFLRGTGLNRLTFIWSVRTGWPDSGLIRLAWRKAADFRAW